MKKRMMSLFMTLALALTMTGTALAAPADKDTNSKGTTITGIGDAQASFVEEGGTKGDKVTVTYTGGLKAGEQYLVLMLSDSTADATKTPQYNQNIVPTVNNILYIDQKAAGADGSISFEVYPKSLSTGVILITGVDADGKPQKLVAAIVKASFVLGDVNGDGEVNVGDGMLLLQYLAFKVEESEIVASAADVNGDGDIALGDGMLLLQFLSGALKTLK